MIIIIAWMVLILNLITLLVQFVEIFAGKTTKQRVTAFLNLLINLATIYLAYQVIFFILK